MSRIFVVAGEASGDALGADLIRELKKRDPSLAVAGCGGPAMEAAGVKSVIDISGLAVFGLFDGLKAYGRVVRLVEAVVEAADAFKPDVAVLIDSWGFTLRVAQRLRARAPGVKLVKYIGPQVWAARAGRARTLAAAVDHLICIHDFEVPYYAPYGLACTVAGHPAIGRMKQGDGAAFRVRHGLGDAPIALVLPGSRRSEVRRVAPTLWRAASLLGARIVCVAAGSVGAAVRAQAPAGAVIVPEAEKEDAFAAATVALCVSGTVTTEAALQGAPLIVGYKLGWFTWALARGLGLYTAPFVTLLNVAAGREVAPEFLQTKLKAEAIAAYAANLIADPAARAAQVEAQNAALVKMGRGGRPAAEIAADAVLGVLSSAR
ncbi:MAG: lipid-A-disaccharide synthase [Hyphomonadaceae bacterium]|nr:lipid-A-disaccharide synthase [Hyphomonadaceae bacterium]